jgi:hypothetical protein
MTAAEPTAIERIRRRTFCGQASWAEGPQHCGVCTFWNDVGRAKSRSTQERACQKFDQLMGRTGPRVPGHALACRFFRPREKDSRR